LKELKMKCFRAITENSIFEIVAVDEEAAMVVLAEDADEMPVQQLEFLGEAAEEATFPGIYEHIII
jgi:hypothetical protein